METVVIYTRENESVVSRMGGGSTLGESKRVFARFETRK